MKHPSETNLALLAGGELSLWTRWKLRRHLARCEQCRDEARRFRELRQQLVWSADEMPAEVNWSRLAPEMKANIHVGLAAGQCVGTAEGPPGRLIWRTAFTVVPVALVLLIGWWLQPSRPRLAAVPPAEGIVLEATGEGIELREQGRVLSLQHPAAGDVTYIVNAQGTLRARYVDSETGQVTINNVYAQ